MRIQKGQRNFDGLDPATLQAYQTQVQQAITNRLAGNGLATTATEEIEINGLALKAVPLEELNDLLSDLANAVQKKLQGSVFTQASFCDPGSQNPGWWR